jgi:hypothetical protein
MKILRLEGNDDIFAAARKAIDLATESREDVTFVFNGVENRVSYGMSSNDVAKAHFDKVTKWRDERREASPAHKIAREILNGQPNDVKDALRDLLSDEHDHNPVTGSVG